MDDKKNERNKLFEEARRILYRPTLGDKERAKRRVITAADQREITLGGLENASHEVAQKLKALGLKKGDKVVISSPNCPEYVAAMLGVWQAGCVIVPVDFRLTTDELVNICQKLSAKAFIGGNVHASWVKANVERAKVPAEAILELTQFSEALTRGEPVTTGGTTHEFEMDDAVLIMLTSGTTGMPKGAVHGFASLVENLADLSQLVKMNPETTVLLPLPLSHIFGFETMLTILVIGAQVGFTASIETFIQALASRHFDIVAAVPAMWSALLQLDPKMFHFKENDILLSGGAGMPQSLADDFRNKFGQRLNNGYGSTESKIVALNLDGPELSVGKWIPTAKIEIVDANDSPLCEGEVGEIRIAGSCLMQGYLGRPDDTKAVLHDGHYHTCDLGYIKDGYLFISGRDKEMINVAGNKVFPSEVEDYLRQHPCVKEVAVFGVPHYKLGQIVKAVVVIKEGDLNTRYEAGDEGGKEAKREITETLKGFCKERLKRELRPMEWEFRPASNPLPKSNTGKVDKKQLQQALAPAH
jgi:long-chain acyl-CoA synthetase